MPGLGVRGEGCRRGQGQRWLEDCALRGAWCGLPPSQGAPPESSWHFCIGSVETAKKKSIRETGSTAATVHRLQTCNASPCSWAGREAGPATSSQEQAHPEACDAACGPGSLQGAATGTLQPTGAGGWPRPTLLQVMAGCGSPWELHGSCTLVPTSTVRSLGTLVNTGVTRRQHGERGQRGSLRQSPTQGLRVAAVPAARWQPGRARTRGREWSAPQSRCLYPGPRTAARVDSNLGLCHRPQVSHAQCPHLGQDRLLGCNSAEATRSEPRSQAGASTPEKRGPPVGLGASQDPTVGTLSLGRTTLTEQGLEGQIHRAQGPPRAHLRADKG